MASLKTHLSDQPLLRIHILDAAHSMVVRHGFDALSMRKLAEVVGYSPASLYLHFSGRDAIAHALGVEAHARLLAALHECDSIADNAERVRSMAHAYVKFGLANVEGYRLIFMQNAAYTEAICNNASASSQTVLSLFARAFDSLNQTPSAAESLWAALHGIVSLNLTAASYVFTPTDVLIDSTLDLYLSGIKKKSAHRPSGPRTA
jgi:AcrR family transcriptional regulator